MEILVRIVTAKNRVLPESTVLPTGSATTVAEKLTGLRGFTLKVDGILLGIGDKVPQGDVYEIVEAAFVPVGIEQLDTDEDEGL